MIKKLLLNRILGFFNLKLIGTTDEFEWSGHSYKLPMKVGDRPDFMEDSTGKIFPIKFQYEEDRNFVIRAVNRALSKPSLHSKSNLHFQNINVRFSSSEVRNIALELKNTALYAHSHKLKRFELLWKLNEVISKYGLQ